MAIVMNQSFHGMFHFFCHRGTIFSVYTSNRSRRNLVDTLLNNFKALSHLFDSNAITIVTISSRTNWHCESGSLFKMPVFIKANKLPFWSAGLLKRTGPQRLARKLAIDCEADAAPPDAERRKALARIDYRFAKSSQSSAALAREYGSSHGGKRRSSQDFKLAIAREIARQPLRDDFCGAKLPILGFCSRGRNL